MKYYKTIQINKVQIRIHRYIMECFLCRKLKKSEIVHHKDGNKFNNNIDNLELTTRSEHLKKHKNIVHKKDLNIYKIYKKQLENYLKTKTPSEISKIYKCHYTNIFYYIKKYGIRYK